MSAEHNHPPRCCCEEIDNGTDGFEPSELLTCPACPEHGDLVPGDPWHWSDGTPVDQAELEAATPYTEQETTNG